MDDFTVTVTGEEIPEESILLQRLQEALKRGNTHVNIINGYIVNTNSTVNLTIGPVLGEITANKAIVMIEVVGKTENIPITAKLYKGEEKGEPVDVLEKDVQAKRPAIFQFEDLEPETEYTGNLNFISILVISHLNNSRNLFEMSNNIFCLF